MTAFTQQRILAVVGTSRQALRQFQARRVDYLRRASEAEARLLLHRRDHPGLGLVKAYHQIQPRGLGRDRFVAEMTRRGHALPRRESNYARTTRSDGHRFPNLIKGLVINDINLIWQSDTTYFRQHERWFYLTFILDVYSRRILGYALSTSLAAAANVRALKMALRQRKGQDLSRLIFHSDGGTQYRYRSFVESLRQHGISSSMCTAATDNAYAEKLNDVIKNEYLRYRPRHNQEQLRRLLGRSVRNYNQRRHHHQLPRRCSPIAYEAWLATPQGAAALHPLSIRDGQAPKNMREATADGPNLTYPGAKATKGVSQILPAHVVLDHPTENRQLRLTF
ncbi:DDE-type integrase/transposase/recombinase [Lewinella sp. IMCC34191]|uniref:DDE-type integrase/transposase/recombinase n=1 Tax=Lewinella sp. IMCC34191 TaxID=2259172 RepID=UPI000E23FFA6|nr:DDE-type integrase/transposase/recombinase [Lewinella sp. IMCC34191]